MRYNKEINEKKVEDKQLNFNTIDKMPKISEWFISLEGEGKSIGEPSLYIRLAGCYSAKCSWCDSKYSWFDSDGKGDLEKIKDEIINSVSNISRIKRLTITGGEPLHFVTSFSSIVEWLHSVGFKFDFIGIESNGNLLSRKENVYKLIRSFGLISMHLNISPTLTISPKLDPEACYANELTQDEITTMYKQVYQNTCLYLQKDKVFFKFVWDYRRNNDDVIDNINRLLDLKVQRKHIMLMPWTPDDVNKDVEIWKDSQKITSRKALELGIKYSPRLHIDIEMD